MRRKKTIQDAHDLAEKNDGKCLSLEYIGANKDLWWKCKNEHLWKAAYCEINRGKWCKICSSRKLTIEYVKNIAIERNGKCLSTIYINSKSDLEWECEFGHVWNAPYDTIQKGSWCPDCQKITIEDAQNLARSKGGECLSKGKFINCKSDLEWKCANNHQWLACYNNVRNKTWCFECSLNRKRLTLSEAKQLAANKNGKCLSENYKNTKTNLMWQCEFNHIWEARLDHVKKNHWCPDCAGRRKLSIERFLDKVYLVHDDEYNYDKVVIIDSKTDIIITCKKHGDFFQTYNNHLSGQGCPDCSFNKRTNEKFVRKFLLDNNIKLEKIRIKLPHNKKTGYSYPDFYIPLLNLIIEYNGLQHYQLEFFGKKDIERFSRQQIRDEELRQYCKKNNINLLEIDGRKYYNKKLPPYLNELLQNNFNLGK